MPNAIERCTTCGDDAVPVRILERAGDEGTGLGPDGRRAAVRLDFVPDVRAGDRVLVHFGVALVRIREEYER
ncbi:MAG TPA: HypC/HybG/HupF family hydrogenase formation chaperone [Candidatus Tumulicola sp.]|nr:HypC/HybG/HupF family hydrogenase formation chaperone [Candidatus Tumulicola sp.]